nr:hypothetical protein P5665_22305 [Bacillus subtilis]
MRKLVLFMVISFVTLGLTLSSGTASAINYLEHYDAQAARESGVSSEYIASAVIDAGKTLKDFKTLSKEEQQKFVDGFSQLETIKVQLEKKKPEKVPMH